MLDFSNPVDLIWANDVLNRRNDALYLHNYLLSRYKLKPNEPGFVLAINAEWRYGKSFMLNCWSQEAILLQHPAIYFDAWQNDFTSDPLLAFISELEEGLSKYFEKIPLPKVAIRKVELLLRNLWKPALTIIASAAAKHVLGLTMDRLHDIVSDVRHTHTESAVTLMATEKDAERKFSDELKKALDPHKTVKESIKNFKERLSNLIDELDVISEVNLPLLIFVDELDRCRPDYAIELLEGIKHLFGVPGVTFVIATNISQLGESVKAVYGSGFDGQRYLQRFFDLQYTLAKTDNYAFCYLKLNEIILPERQHIAFGLENERTIPPSDGTASTSLEIISLVLAKHAETFGLGLRDLSRVVTLLESAFIALSYDRIHIFFLVFLCVVYQQNPLIFKKIAKEKVASADTGINEIVLNRGIGGKIKLIVNSGNGYSGTREVSMLEIAAYYFSNLESTNNNGMRNSGFPYHNLEHWDYAKVDGINVAKCENYFSIVQQAGVFSKIERSPE